MLDVLVPLRPVRPIRPVAPPTGNPLRPRPLVPSPSVPLGVPSPASPSIGSPLLDLPGAGTFPGDLSPDAGELPGDKIEGGEQAQEGKCEGVLYRARIGRSDLSEGNHLGTHDDSPFVGPILSATISPTGSEGGSAVLRTFTVITRTGVFTDFATITVGEGENLEPLISRQDGLPDNCGPSGFTVPEPITEPDRKRRPPPLTRPLPPGEIVPFTRPKKPRTPTVPTPPPVPPALPPDEPDRIPPDVPAPDPPSEPPTIPFEPFVSIPRTGRPRLAPPIPGGAETGTGTGTGGGTSTGTGAAGAPVEVNDPAAGGQPRLEPAPVLEPVVTDRPIKVEDCCAVVEVRRTREIIERRIEEKCECPEDEPFIGDIQRWQCGEDGPEKVPAFYFDLQGAISLIADELADIRDRLGGICPPPDNVPPEVLATGQMTMAEASAFIPVPDDVRRIQLVITGTIPQSLRLYRNWGTSDQVAKYGLLSETYPGVSGGVAKTAKELWVWTRRESLYLGEPVAAGRGVRVFLRPGLSWVLFDTGERG